MDTLDVLGLYAWAFLGAVVPALALFFYVYWYDRKHPEPALQLLKGFIFGVLSIGLLEILFRCIPSYFQWAMNGGDTVFGKIQHAFFKAAIPEEFVKLVMLCLLLWKNRHFDERLDSIIYAVCVGMGFAAFENIEYVFTSGRQWGNVVAARAVLAVPGHYIDAVTMGYFYSVAKFSPANGIKRAWQLLLIILVPVLLHGAYDSITMTMSLDSLGTAIYTILVLTLFVFCYSFHKYCNRLIEKQLAADERMFDSVRQEEGKKKRQEKELKRKEEAAKEAEAALSDFDKARILQQAIIDSRTEFYIPDDPAMKALDDFLAHPEADAIIITGPSGCGKSALLANWYKRHQDDNKQNIIYHFIGNGCILTDYRDVAEQLCQEIEYHGGLQPPDSRHPLVVLLDGIDRVFGQETEDPLDWLPATNGQIRYVFSTNQNHGALKSLKEKGYSCIEIAPLNNVARAQIVELFMTKGLHLSEERASRIINDPESANPLVLRTLLQELTCSKPEELDKDIDYYLEPCSISDYFQRILERKELLMGEFFAQQVLSVLVAGASDGLRKEEIRKACRMTNPTQWDVLINNFGGYLLMHGDRYTLSHQLILEAITTRYSKYLLSANTRLKRILNKNDLSLNF